MTATAPAAAERPAVLPMAESSPSASVDEAASLRALAAEHPIVFFDGSCGLCNASVDFVLARDREGKFRFAPLQGSSAAAVLEPDDIASLKSIVLLDAAGMHRRSRAVRRMLWQLGGVWSAAAAGLWAVPGPLRDLGYRLISKSRYRLFGKKATCRIPSPEERARFLP